MGFDFHRLDFWEIGLAAGIDGFGVGRLVDFEGS